MQTNCNMKKIILTIFGALAAAGTLGATEELRKNGITGEKVEPEIRIETGTSGRQVDDTSKDEGSGKTCRRMAVVELSSIYMRQEPDYESALETQELMGTVVEIVSESRYWKEIVSPQPYRAWTTEMGLVEMTQEQLKAYMEAPKVMFTGLYGHVYTAPSLKADTVCDLVGGDILRLYCTTKIHHPKCPGDQILHDQSNSQGKTRQDVDSRKYTKGHHCATGIKLKGRWTKVMLPSGRIGYIPAADLKIHEGFISITQGEGSANSIAAETTERIIAEAQRLMGSPYLWGGMTSKGTDCSGLVRLCFLKNGILLPRNASQQLRCGDKVAMETDVRFWEENHRIMTDTTGSGTKTYTQDFCMEMHRRTENLERGDLIFFGNPAKEPGQNPRVTHVGIYLGNGRFIHSSQVVRINSLIPGEPDYYENSHRLVGAVRL